MDLVVPSTTVIADTLGGMGEGGGGDLVSLSEGPKWRGTFLTWLHEPEKDPAASRKFSSSHPIEKWVLYFPLSQCRFISCESGVWTKRNFRNSESP